MVVHESPSAMTVAYDAHMPDHAQHLPCTPGLADFPGSEWKPFECSRHCASAGQYANGDQVDRVL